MVSNLLERQLGTELRSAMGRPNPSARRRNGVLAMAITAVVALYLVRARYDLLWLMYSELALMSGCFSYVAAKRHHELRSSLYQNLFYGFAVVCPWLVNALSRNLGYGNGAEVNALSSFAWFSLAVAILADRPRMLALSVVCSGFMTLFITSMSDYTAALLPAAVWGALCLWWLVANHWETVATTAVVNIERPKLLRMNILLLGAVLFAGAALLAARNTPVLRQLQMELMPTSGGSSYRDSAARSGVGDGESLVAARNTANSFGNVDTDLFVDSPEPSLYDLFSEQYGEPRKKKKFQRAQSLDSTQVREQDAKLSEGKRSSESFSIDRVKSKSLAKLNDLQTKALMFWSGRSNILLAAARYDAFDGSEWSASESDVLQDWQPAGIKVGDQTWFRWPYHHRDPLLRTPFVGPQSEALKFVNYRAPIIPIEASMTLWNIDLVDRADFFAMQDGHCLLMADREHVPDYTVVKFVNHEMDLEAIDALLQNFQPSRSLERSDAPNWQQQLIAKAAAVTAQKAAGWQQVSSVIQFLRENFEVLNASSSAGELTDEAMTDESSAEQSSMAQFVKSKRGYDYQFATAAALMLRELGYETRFVSGFHVRPRFLNAAKKEVAIVKEDVHTWVEIHLGNNQWIPLEPTPSYALPNYRKSLWYRLKEARVWIAIALGSTLGLGVLLYACRRGLFELYCRCLWMIGIWSGDSRQVRWLTKLLDQRLALAGKARPPGILLRKWLMSHLTHSDTLGIALATFFNEADRLVFGRGKEFTPQGRAAMRQLWRELTIGRLRSRSG